MIFNVFNYVLKTTHQPFPSVWQLSSQAADTRLHGPFETKASAPLTNVTEWIESCWGNGKAKMY